MAKRKRGRPAPWWFSLLNSKHFAGLERYTTREVKELLGLDITVASVRTSLRSRADHDGFMPVEGSTLRKGYWLGRTLWRIGGSVPDSNDPDSVGCESDD